MVAPIIPTLEVEMDFGSPILDMTGDAILDMTGAPILDLGWTNVTADVRAAEPIHIHRGNFGNDVKDRVGNIGTCSLAMDNSADNSGGKIGYYSPDHPNKRRELDDDTLMRVGLTYGVKKRYKFQGRIKDISPDSDRYGKLLSHFSAEDWFAEAAIAPMRGLEVQLNKTDDQLIRSLLTIMDHPPGSTDLSVGLDTNAYAFHDELGESTKVLAVLQKIAQTGAGVIFVVGNETTGEILQFRNRQDLGTVGAPVATLDHSMRRLQPKRTTRKSIKEIVVVGNPVFVDAAATTVLFSLRREIQIPPGGTALFTARYTDPSGAGKRISGTEIVNPPVADTHFKFSSSSGSGNDLNSSLQFLTYKVGADQVDVVVKNNANVVGNLWFFTVVGKGIYPYDAISYTAVNPNTTKGDTLKFEMPYQDDYNVLVDVGNALMAFYQNNETDVPEVEFIANRSEALMNSMLDVEPNSLVAVIESDVTGINSQYYANGLDIMIHRKGTKIDVVWSIVPAKLANFSIWDENLWDEDGPVYAY